MGVLACNRAGCRNVMCDRYSDQYGYICEECFQELLSKNRFINIKSFIQEEKHAGFIDEGRHWKEMLETTFPLDDGQ